MQSKNAELKAGIVVISASVALLGLLFFSMGGQMFTTWRYLALRLEPGALAPHESDPVFMNGQKIGDVQTVAYQTEIRRGEELRLADRVALQALLPNPETDELPADVEARELYLRVVVRIEEGKEIPVGTEGRMGESLTGQRALQLVPGRSMDSLELSETPDMARELVFIAQAPDVTSLAQKLDRLVDDVVITLANLRKNLDKGGRALDQAHDTIAKFDERVLDGGKLESTLQNVEAATASLKRSAVAIEARVGTLAATLQETVGDFRELAASGVRIAAGIEEKVPLVLDDIRGFTSKLDHLVAKVDPQIEGLLVDVRKVGKNLVSLSDDLAAAGPTVRELVGSVGKDVDVLFEDLIETGQNLADASEDIRAHPWKLMKEPSADEIAYENLRNSMQNYVRAMQRVDRTAATLRQLLPAAEADPDARDLLRRALKQLEASVERYRYFEQRLMDLLQQHRVPGAAVPVRPPPPVKRR